MRILTQTFHVPPLATPGGRWEECQAAFISIEAWPYRGHNLFLQCSYPSLGTILEHVIADPEPGMRFDLRGEDGTAPSVRIESYPKLPAPTQSYENKIAIFEDIRDIVVTHSDHIQFMALGKVSIPAAGWNVHSTFTAWRSGQIGLVVECSAEPTALSFRLSGRMTGGMGESYYHSTGTQYRTSSPDTLRGYITPQPRVTDPITHGGYVIAGIPYRLEFKTAAVGAVDISADVYITPHSMMP